jgi:DnaK suppressor protein
MKRKDQEKYRDQLKALGQQIMAKLPAEREEALRSTSDDTRGNLSHVPLHMADLSSDQYEQEVAAEALRVEQEILSEIADALDRIDKGDFGTCEECKKAIPSGRLQAAPYARFCIACAEKAQAS